MVHVSGAASARAAATGGSGRHLAVASDRAGARDHGVGEVDGRPHRVEATVQRRGDLALDVRAVGDLVGVHAGTSSSLVRRVARARWTWLLTVPTEQPRVSAVWASVRSS